MGVFPPTRGPATAGDAAGDFAAAVVLHAFKCGDALDALAEVAQRHRGLGTEAPFKVALVLGGTDVNVDAASSPARARKPKFGGLSGFCAHRSILAREPSFDAPTATALTLAACGRLLFASVPWSTRNHAQQEGEEQAEGEGQEGGPQGCGGG